MSQSVTDFLKSKGVYSGNTLIGDMIASYFEKLFTEYALLSDKVSDGKIRVPSDIHEFTDKEQRLILLLQGITEKNRDELNQLENQREDAITAKDFNKIAIYNSAISETEAEINFAIRIMNFINGEYKED